MGAFDWLIFSNLECLAQQLDKSRLAVSGTVLVVLLAALTVHLALEGLANLGVIELMGH